MASSTTNQHTRDTIKTLAAELVTLADTFEPSAEGAWGLESPLVSKAKAIIAAAQTPIEHAVGMVSAGMEVATLRNLIYLQAIDSLPETGSITLAELAKRTNTDPPLLQRLFRPFVGNGFIRQDAPDTYAHTPLSLAYRADEMGGTLFTACTDDGVDVLSHLPQWLETKRPTRDAPYAEPGSLQDNLLYNPWNWRWGTEGQSNYATLAKDPARLARLHRLLGSVAHLNPFVGFYDFAQLAVPEHPSPSTSSSSTSTSPDNDTDPPRPLFVDVGGGHGPAIAHILATHPEIRPEQCVLQDLAPVLASLADKPPADPSLPVLPATVVRQVHDYFTPQPVRGARAYHLRAVAHNLSDANLLRVLEALRPAMAGDSRVLIADNVMPESGVRGLSAFMDLMMMSMGAKERTEREFRAVLAEAGFRVEGVHRAGGGRNYAIVEARVDG